MNLKKSMISVATAAVLVTGFAGCGESTSTTTGDASGVIVDKNSPTGTVTGLVQDTNGNLLSGVTVHLAGQETITNHGGQYTFTNVSVTTTDGIHTPLVVTATAPTVDGMSYLDATTTVSPQAQLDHCNDSASGCNKTNTTFIDGFMAQATPIIIVALTGTVTGSVREDMQNAICLEIEQIENIVYEITEYCTVPAEGTFTLSNLPVDITMKYKVDDYSVLGDDYVKVSDAIITNVGYLTLATQDEFNLLTCEKDNYECRAQCRCFKGFRG